MFTRIYSNDIEAMNAIKYIILFITAVGFAQSRYTIKGHFNATANKEISLKGFSIIEEYPLDKTTTDDSGNFTVTYPETYIGAAMLEIAKGKKVIVLLNHENFEIRWDDLTTTKSLNFTNSIENSTFDAGLKLYQNTQEKKAGIAYLIPFYNGEPQKNQFFKTELTQLNAVMPDYLNKLSQDTYVRYYLKLRILISDLTLNRKRAPESLPELEAAFNDLDFGDERLVRSGLYEGLLDAYVAAVEFYGDKKSEHLKSSINVVLARLKTKPELKQNVTEYWFNLFEKRSLFEFSEYIALAMLNDDSCQLDDKHKALFEQYRKMANGNVAPDIAFVNGKNTHLYTLKNQYKLVVFGASWCSKCVAEIPKLKTFYEDWKKQDDLEIIFVSLDSQKREYEQFTSSFPWISSCDYLSWESKAAKDYCIFSTPTMYLLDANNKIKVKPTSAEQANAWLTAHR